MCRQGSLALQGPSGAWDECHCVLTKAGRLHWFAGDSVGVDGGQAVLARCQFEEGDAPAFNLVEKTGAPIATSLAVLGKQRRLAFKASGVEECCEWAIALREAIAVDS